MLSFVMIVLPVFVMLAMRLVLPAFIALIAFMGTVT
jgi:hypothetical protein